MSSCLFGFSVRRGAFLVGIFEIVFETLSVIFYSLGLAALSSYEDEDEIRVIEKNFRIPFIGLESTRSIESIVSSLTTMFSVGLFVSIICIGFSILLLHATYRSNLVELKIWRIFKIGTILMAISYNILMLFSGFSTVPQITSDITRIIIHSYFLWIVHSFIIKLANETCLALSASFIHNKRTKIDDVSFPL